MPNNLILVFKADSTVTLVFRCMTIVSFLPTIAGFILGVPMMACLGLFMLLVFMVLSYSETKQTIELCHDKVVFKNFSDQAWFVPYDNFVGLELTTTTERATKFSPGRTILLRFMDKEDKFCAEVNLNAFDKDVIKCMIEQLVKRRKGLSLNYQATFLLKGRTYKEITMGPSGPSNITE